MVNGWSIQKLSDLSNMKSGLGITEANIEKSGNYPCYGGNGLRGFTSEYTHDGQFALIGRQGALCGNVTLVSGRFFASEHAVVVTPKPNTDIVFLSYVLTDMRLNQYSESSAQPGLSVNKVLEIECFAPNNKLEQRRIAETLSDMDSYIASLEKLIAKKRAIKQGTMQELLSGKRRLLEFDGEWVRKPLLDCCELLQGLTYSPSNVQSFGLLVLRSSNIKNNKLTFNDCIYVDCNVDENKYVKTNDILICVRNGSSALIGKSCVIDQNYNATFGAFMSVLRGDYTGYIAYIFSSDIVQEQIRNRSSATINQITKRDFEDIVIPTPPTLAEQTAIAAILSDMDAEIDTLMAKLNKVRDIKQGMMQELLTGQIRLMKEDSEDASAAKVVELPKREPKVALSTGGHNQQFDDAVMIAGIVNALYSDKYLLGRKKVQKCLYLLRRHQEQSTAAFKKKAAGPYADEVRYKGGEPIAQSAHYITTTTIKDKGTTFARGKNISQALGYIESWGKQGDIKWVADKLKFKRVDDLELLATVDMAICDLEELRISVSVASIKHLIATNEEWKEKLKRQTFSDANIARAIQELQNLLHGGN